VCRSAIDVGRSLSLCSTNAVRFVTPRPTRRIRLIVDASLTKPALASTAMRVDSDVEPPEPDCNIWVSVGVADTGPGLTPEEQTKLFRRFGQANPQVDSLSGFGLGASRAPPSMAALSLTVRRSLRLTPGC
jgi:signal transduction histidine kinase